MPSDDGVTDCNHPPWSENVITTTLVILQLTLNLILWSTDRRLDKWCMGHEVFLGAALWLGTFRGIIVPLSSVSSRPAFSGSGRVIVIRLDAGLNTVLFRNVGTTIPVTQHNIPTTCLCWAQVSNETACNSAAAVCIREQSAGLHWIMILKTTLNVHRPDYLKSHTDVYFFTSARQEGLVLGINIFLFCYCVVTSDTLLSGPVHEMKWNANLMQQGNFIDVFLARHVSGTYAHHQEH